jgi:25S rRNA (uracil2843-N3)-methyltransferase
MPPKQRQKKLHHPPSKAQPASYVPPTKLAPLPIETLILTTITAAITSTLSNSALPTIIQNIKSFLYDKQFLKVFEDESVLDAYAARWVPSRALAFREIIGGSEYLTRVLEGRKAGGVDKGKSKEVEDEELDRTRVICLGGGAGSELLALAALVSPQNSVPAGEPIPKKPEDDDEEAEPIQVATAYPTCDIHLVDLGPYQSLLAKFTTALHEHMPTTRFTQTFHQADILAPSEPDLFETLIPEDSSSPTIITLLYTLTELFIQSRPATINLLTRITRNSPKGTLFLVVDSANEEASALGVGKEGRSYS